METDKIPSCSETSSNTNNLEDALFSEQLDSLAPETSRDILEKEFGIKRHLWVNMKRRSEISKASAASSVCSERTIPTISKLLIEGTASVFQEAIEELDLLRVIDNTPNLQVNMKYVPLANRLAETQPQKEKDATEQWLRYKFLTQEEKAFYKFQQQRLYLQTIFQEALEPLRDNFCCKRLYKRLDEFFKSRKEEEDLLFEVAYNRMIIPRLKKCLLKEEQVFKTVIQARSEEIGRLKDLLEDHLYQARIKENYIVEWENSRNEQSALRHKREIDQQKHIIEDNHGKIWQEKRVNSEIIKFLNVNIEDMKKQMKEVEVDYEDQLVKYAKQIEIVTAAKESTKLALDKLTEKYNARKKLITDYYEHKEIQKEQKKIMDHKNNSATRIQSWWRMLMVRKGLGPYKKKKPKSKKKGSAKGKKGQKK